MSTTTNTIELKKQSLSVAELILDSHTQTSADADVIVPDTKPDVARILHTDAFPLITDRIVTPDKAKIAGSIMTNILYTTDTGATHGMYADIPFEHSTVIKGATPEMRIECEVDIKSIQETVINSRKLNVKITISVFIRLTDSQSIDVASDVEGDGYEMLTHEVTTSATVGHFKGEIPVRDNVEFPSDKPSADVVLKTSAAILPQQCKMMNNKVQVKGAVVVTVLYQCASAESPLQDLTFELPFFETIDAYSADETMSCEVQYYLKQYSCDLREDNDGDGRILSLSATVEACAVVRQETTQKVLCDIYNTGFPMEVKKQTAAVDRVIADVKSQAILREGVNLSHDVPEVSSVYSTVAKPVISGVTVENGKVTVSGEFEISLQYISPLEQSRINNHRCTVPFKQAVDAEDVAEGMNAEASVVVVEASAIVGLGWNVEVKLIADVSVKVIKSVKFDYVTEAYQLELPASEKKKSCAIKIYFVQPNDTPWMIAKKYRTKISSILKANELEPGDVLKPGMQIVIP